MCPLAGQFACPLSLQVALSARDEALVILRQKKMLSLTLILLLAVEAQKNRAPVCAIGLKKGARVRLPSASRLAKIIQNEDANVYRSPRGAVLRDSLFDVTTLRKKKSVGCLPTTPLC